jgi:Rrf2 family protein
MAAPAITARPLLFMTIAPHLVRSSITRIVIVAILVNVCRVGYRSFQMRLRFSRRTDYALRAALELARRSNGLVKRAELATAISAPPSVMAQALADLVRGGVVVATAGPAGGYRLAEPASEISVLAVVDAIEPPEETRRCVLHDRACSWEGACPLHATVVGAEAAYREQLGLTTLADAAGALPRP